MKIVTTLLVSLVLVIVTCSTAEAQVQRTDRANQPLLEQQCGTLYRIPARPALIGIGVSKFITGKAQFLNFDRENH